MLLLLSILFLWLCFIGFFIIFYQFLSHLYVSFSQCLIYLLPYTSFTLSIVVMVILSSWFLYFLQFFYFSTNSQVARCVQCFESVFFWACLRLSHYYRCGFIYLFIFFPRSLKVYHPLIPTLQYLSHPYYFFPDVI